MSQTNRAIVRGKSERVTSLLPSDLYAQICHDAADAVIRETLVERHRPQNGRSPR